MARHPRRAGRVRRRRVRHRRVRAELIDRATKSPEPFDEPRPFTDDEMRQMHQLCEMMVHHVYPDGPPKPGDPPTPNLPSDADILAFAIERVFPEQLVREALELH